MLQDSPWNDLEIFTYCLIVLVALDYNTLLGK